MTRQEIISSLRTMNDVTWLGGHFKEAFRAAVRELETQPETLSRRDEIASRILSGILASQTEMRAIGADNLCEGYKYNAINEAVALADALINELNKEEKNENHIHQP